MEFTLQDESDDDVLQVESMNPPTKDDDEEEDDDLITNAIVRLQAPQKYPTKVLPEEERRIWSAITWPSSLVDVLQRSHEMDKIKTKLTVDGFIATQSMLPPIPSPRIVPLDEGSPA